MNSRFQSVTEDVLELLKMIRDERFPEIEDARILPLFDLQKRISDGVLTLASIHKTNDLTRFLTMDDEDQGLGLDYVIRIDKLVWENLEGDDRIRLIRQELRHTKFDKDAEHPFKLRKHTIEDFYEEVKLNENDLEWKHKAIEAATKKYRAAHNKQGDLFNDRKE